MKIHPLIVSAAIAAILGLQAWMLTKISTLSERVAGLAVKVELLVSTGPQRIAKQ
jgi:hypothetical protein